MQVAKRLTYSSHCWIADSRSRSRSRSSRSNIISIYSIINIIIMISIIMYALPSSGQAETVAIEQSRPTASTAARLYEACGSNGTAQCVPSALCNKGMTIGTKFYADHTRTMWDEQCHYLEKCCELDETLSEPAAANYNASDFRTCGSRLDNWIHLRPNGYKMKEAKFAEFPWIVAIFTSNGQYVCSGALIAPAVVITAAHCAEPLQANATLSVRAGEWDVMTDLEPLPQQDRNVSEVIIHSNYTKAPVMHNLALLLLAAPFELAPHIQTVCLPTPSTNFNYTQCFVSGWDRAQFEDPSYSEIMLKKVPMFALPSDQCAAKIRLAILGRRYTLHDSFICTGGDKHDFVCRSGGAGGVPLICAINNCEQYFLAGLMARGARCDGTQLLGIYTNIKYYRTWIDSQLS